MFVSGLLMLICLIVIHESGHAMAARLCGVGIKKFSIGFGPGITLFRTKNFPVVLAPLILGGYVMIKSKGMKPEDLAGTPGLCLEDVSYWKKIFIFSAGVIMNLVSAVAMLTALFVFFPGERVNFMGIAFPIRNDVSSWYQAPLAAAWSTAELFADMLSAIFRAVPIFISQFIETVVHLSPQPGAGVIGTMRITETAAANGAASFLFTAYFVSVILAAVNILPLGMLDGGHIAIQTIEKIFGTGKAVRIAQFIIFLIGAAFIAVLMLIMVGSDIADVFRMLKG